MRGDRPRVSVVIPCYNYAIYVGQAIESALRQTYPSEVVVVDDGSTDDSPEVIASFGPDIIALRQENRGLTTAWNYGYSAASGDVVMFLDADDFLYAHAVESVVGKWSPEATCWMWYLDVVDAEGNPTGKSVPDVAPTTDRLADLTQVRGPAARITPPSSGLAWNRFLLDEVLPLPDGKWNAADAFLIDAAPFFGTVELVDAHLGVYRIHGESMTERLKEADLEILNSKRSLYELRCERLASLGVGDPEEWLKRSWRQQTLRCLIAKHDGTEQPSVHTMALAGWAANGSVVKRAGLAGLATAIRILPRRLSLALSHRVIDFKWT